MLAPMPAPWLPRCLQKTEGASPEELEEYNLAAGRYEAQVRSKGVCLLLSGCVLFFLGSCGGRMALDVLVNACSREPVSATVPGVPGRPCALSYRLG